MWAMSEMLLDQKCGSRSAPWIVFAMSGENVPFKLVEVITPTFSNTRPFMTLITPPSSARIAPGRVHGLRSKRPGGRCDSWP